MRQILRFGAVGLVATAAHVGAALVAANWFSAPAQLANIFGFTCAVALSFVGHSKLTFGLKHTRVEDAPRFVISALIGLSTSVGVTFVMHDVLGHNIGITMLVVGLMAPVVSFVLLRFWVYSDRPSKPR